MYTKIRTAMVAVGVVAIAGFGVPVASAAPGQAVGTVAGNHATSIPDPSCKWVIYLKEKTQKKTTIHTEKPKCGQKVRSVTRCMKEFSTADVYGNTRTTAGSSTSTCGSGFYAVKHGRQIYNGGWKTVWY